MNYSPWVQTNSQVTAWDMLFNGGTHWAQVGWWEYAGGTRYTFTQYTDSSTWHTNFFTPKAVGTSTTYDTLYDPGSGKFTFTVAGATVLQVTPGWAPNNSEVLGEIDTLASQMPGATGVHELFTGTHIYLGSWVNYDGTVYNSNSTLFGSQKIDSLRDEAWDKACSS